MGLISPGSGVRAPPGAFRSYSVMVITKDSDSFNPGSSPGRTFVFCLPKVRDNFTEKGLPHAVSRALSSAVERRIADPEVTGSIPVVPFFKFCFCVNATAFQRRNGMRPAVCAHGALV